MRDTLCFGSILLERNRWAAGRQPTYRVSDWLERIAEAGFDGVELWENHAARAAEAELQALADAEPPVLIFNSYAGLEDEATAARERATQLTRRLGAAGVKFNAGPDPARRAQYLRGLRGWMHQMPQGTTMLCECHPGTILEEPSAARAFFDDLGGEDWGVIVHAFNAVDSLRGWFDAFGPDVRHAHLQMRDDGDRMVGFGARPDAVARAVGLMQDYAFSGSMTFEFTEGVGAPGEDMEELWQSALADLALVRRAFGG